MTSAKASASRKPGGMSNGKAVRNRGQQTRQAILDKATEILIEQGYDALVLRDLASQVGIKLGNLQYYFPTREDLLVELSLEFFHKQSLEIDELFRHEETPKARMQAAIDYMINGWSQSDAHIYILMYYLSAHNKKIWKGRQKIWLNFYEQMENLLKESSPDLTSAQRRKKVLLITSLVDGLHMQPGFAPGDVVKPSNRFLLNDVRDLALEIAGF
jgi:AcrR family transcriptional regulator